MGRRPELVGGGLARSLGGWSEVLALRGRGEKSRSDQRILGNSEFVQEVISGLDDLVKKNLRLSGQRIDINAFGSADRYKCIFILSILLTDRRFY
jgi:hypothetical protein